MTRSIQILVRLPNGELLDIVEFDSEATDATQAAKDWLRLVAEIAESY